MSKTMRRLRFALIPMTILVVIMVSLLTLGGIFAWTIHLAKGGSAAASFPSGQSILRDELSGGPTYGTLAAMNVSTDAAADLWLAKAASAPSVPTGGSVTFTLFSSNTGNATASGYFIDDFIPLGVTVETFTASDDGDCDQVAPFFDGGPSWTGPAIIRCGPFTTPAGQTDMVTLTATVTASPGTITNGALTDSNNDVAESNEDADDPELNCTGEGSDPSPATEPDNYDCLAISVTTGPDLVLTKSSSAPSVGTGGGSITFTLTSSNIGSGTASGYFIDDFIPAGVAVTGFTATDFADCDQIVPFLDTTPPWTGPATIRCGPFTTPAGFSETTTLWATVTASPGTIINSALTDSNNDVAESNEDSDDPELNCTGEGTDAFSDTEPDNYDCLAITVTGGPDLALTKSSSLSVVPSGGSVTFTLTSSNTGITTASGYFIDDFIPTGVTVTAFTATDGAGCAVNVDTTPPWVGPATIRCGPFITPADFTDTVTLSATLTASPGTVLNGALADSDNDVAESNEDADDPALLCTSVGEGPDAFPASEPDNYDCLAITVTTANLWGDVDCDGDVDAVDSLKILRDVAALPVSQTEPCPDIGDSVEVIAS